MRVTCGRRSYGVWGLEEYGKIVYLDADCLVVGSADQLFATCRDVAFAAARRSTRRTPSTAASWS